VADVASIARALEESQRKAEDKNPEASLAQDVTAVSTPLAVAAPIGLEIPAGSADDQAFDAELEAVYDNPVPVRMASIDPDPRRERDGSPGVPTGANVAVAAALADALAPVAEKQDPQPESTDLGELLAQTPDRTSPEEPGLTPPSEQSVTAEAQPEATAPQATVEATASSAAVTAVPLIHDARFGGPGPREARAKTSFLGGILVGAAVVFVLAIVLVVVVLLLLLRRGHEEAAAPASTPSAAPMVTSAAPATVVKPTSSARPPEPAIEPAKPETTEDPEKAEETEEKPSSTNEAPAPKAAPRPRPRPRPKPKPSFVPDEI
jgi:hypothetical protein